MGSSSSPRATSNLASNKSLSRGLTDKDPSAVNSGVTTRTWKLPANIVVFSVAWLDEIASDSLDESFDETSASSTAEQSTASNSFSSESTRVHREPMDTQAETIVLGKPKLVPQ